MRVTNTSGISLPLAVWLLHDEYDYNNTPNYISVTTLMRPLKQIILAKRIPPSEQKSDVQDYISRALGHALHDSIEKAWVRGSDRSLKLLGYPQEVIDRIIVNPTPEQLASIKDIIPVYLEQRSHREITVEGRTFVIGGKYDMVADGEVYDNKSTSAYSWVFGTRDEDHCKQGSCYKWLNPTVITGDQIHINYIFTDWQKMQAKTNPKYPQKRVETKSIPLWSSEATEQFIRAKLALLVKYWDAPEDQLPDCTDEELWRSEPSFKYYKDPETAKAGGRSTKNFDTLQEANAFRAEKGVGIVKTIPGEVKACGYCPAFLGCKQKDQYVQ